MSDKRCGWCGDLYWGIRRCRCDHMTTAQRLEMATARVVEWERQRHLSEGDRVRELWATI